MSRIIESKENQMRLQKQFGLALEEKRQAMMVGMLADIADSFALLCDMYAIANGINLEEKTVGEDSAYKQ